MLCGLRNSCDYCETIELVNHVTFAANFANFSPHFLSIYCLSHLAIFAVHWTCAVDSSDKLWAFLASSFRFFSENWENGPKYSPKDFVTCSWVGTSCYVSYAVIHFQAIFEQGCSDLCGQTFERQRSQHPV